MNREDIIRMAREADQHASANHVKWIGPEVINMDWVVARDERFAALVAAAERETFYGQDRPDACRNGCPIGQICDYCQIVAPVQKMIAKAVAAERESWPAEMEAMERQVNILTDALAQAKAEEREACAKVCEDLDAWNFDDPGSTAAAAIREALAEQCVCGEPDTLGTHRTDGPCLADQPAPQQEPVAYAVYHRMGGSKSLHWPEQHSPDGDANQYQLVPLYTSPPASKPLSCYINAAGINANDSPHIVVEKLERAIEAKLREKNHG